MELDNSRNHYVDFISLISSTVNACTLNLLQGVNITGNTVVTSDYGVTVFWNNVYNARVILRGRYLNRTVGLCGTYNNVRSDDFWTSYGTTITDEVEFANSWKVDPSCENATVVPNPCDVNSDRRWIARANCSTLLRAPFNECASHINATEEGYIADCEYDMCACEDDPVVCYCQALAAYAADCASYVGIQWMEREEFAICSKCEIFNSLRECYSIQIFNVYECNQLASLTLWC